MLELSSCWIVMLKSWSLNVFNQNEPFKDEEQNASFKDPVRTAL